MGAPFALALFLVALFILGLLAAPIIWLLTAAHDRREREQTEPKVIGVERARSGTCPESKLILKP
jgi:hypothetical protein